MTQEKVFLFNLNLPDYNP